MLGKAGDNQTMNDISLTFDDFTQFDVAMSSTQSYFIISQRISSDNEDAVKYESKKISFDNLAKCLSHYAISAKSAAYAESSDFALSIHDHDIYVSASYIDNLYPKLHDENSLVPILSVYDTTHNVSSIVYSALDAFSINKAQISDIVDYLPYLGAIDYICAKDIQTYKDYFDYTNEQFIGWVLANQTSYMLSDFCLSDDILSTETFNVVEQSEGISSFEIPGLNHFCKICMNTDSATVHDASLYVPKHTHDISSDESNAMHIESIGDVTVQQDELQKLIYMYTNQYNQFFAVIPKEKYLSSYESFVNSSAYNKHIATAPPDIKGSYVKGSLNAGKSGTNVVNYKYPCKAKLNNVTLRDLDMLSSSQINESNESYPSHNLMPVVIYIGPSRFSSIVNLAN